ncbi:outer membrane beta-barrel protein, partial [Flavobacterium sp. CGRL2]
FWQRTHNYEKENISNAILNYAFPISEKTIIETGYKGTFRFFNSDFQSADEINNEYVINPRASNIFDFNEWKNVTRNKTQFQIREFLKTNYGGVRHHMDRLN